MISNVWAYKTEWLRELSDNATHKRLLQVCGRRVVMPVTLLGDSFFVDVFLQ